MITTMKQSNRYIMQYKRKEKKKKIFHSKYFLSQAGLKALIGGIWPAGHTLKTLNDSMYCRLQDIVCM